MKYVLLYEPMSDPILWWEKFRRNGTNSDFCNHWTNSCPNKHTNDGINGNNWSLKGGELKLNWNWQGLTIPSRVEKNENLYAFKKLKN